MADTVPQQILHYVIADKIADSATGDIYKAWDTVLERFVAIRFINSDLIQYTSFRAQVLATLRALADTDHPNICSLYGVHKVNDTYFVAMELVEGRTVRDILRTGPVDNETFLHWAMAVAGVLNHAHQQHIIHGNLNPDNIIVREDGSLRVMNFGFCTLPIEREDPEYQPALETIRYRSPEQITGEEVTPLTDLFSTGCIFFEALSGYPAFPGNSRRMVEEAILHNDPDFKDLLPDRRTPGDTVLVLEKLLARKPEDRFYNAGQFQITMAEIAAFEKEAGSRRLNDSFLAIKPRTPKQYLMISVLAALLVIFWLVITTVPR
jgi:serine/threonine-protein kinase